MNFRASSDLLIGFLSGWFVLSGIKELIRNIPGAFRAVPNDSSPVVILSMVSIFISLVNLIIGVRLLRFHKRCLNEAILYTLIVILLQLVSGGYYTFYTFAAVGGWPTFISSFLGLVVSGSLLALLLYVRQTPETVA